MKYKSYLFVFFLVLSFSVFGQNQLRFHIIDSLSHESLPGVTIIEQSSKQGKISDAQGNAYFKVIAEKDTLFQFQLIGYKSNKHIIKLPFSDSTVTINILLIPENHDMETVIISSTRTNSRIEDLATKIEVLGQGDIDEESSVVPGSVTSILGDLSIITIQKTSPLNGNEAIRMQGLDARYTQIMRDGIPLYGGFSGSLGVLSIPPLDLKQVEIIKGSASTLYGGGAIGGLINFISKTPGDSLLTTVTLNATSLKETNLNFFSSAKKKKLGFTLFMGLNTKKATDINKDGYTEVPNDQNSCIHPRLFIDLNEQNKIIIGLTSTIDSRKSGDIQAFVYGVDSLHTLLEKEKTIRNTIEGSYESKFNATNQFNIKAAFSQFIRRSNNSGFSFNGVQNSVYAEISELHKWKAHTFVGGLNIVQEEFRKLASDTVLFTNYKRNTPGIFLQDDWQMQQKIMLQGGLRYDYTLNFGDFILPRIALFYKASDKFSIRVAAGTGYKTPNLFDFSDPNPLLINATTSVKPEKSYGSNADFNFHTWISDKLSIQLDEAIYYTHIRNVLQTGLTANGMVSIFNANYSVRSYGTDTYLRIRYDEIELYLGYNHTEAFKENSIQKVNLPFNPKDKISGTLAYEIEGHWRMGVETSFTGNQYVYDNKRVHNIYFMAAMIEHKFENGSMVLNCENLLDQRQSKFETLAEGTNRTPIFKPVWGPLEGRVINLSVKLTI